MLAEIFSQSSKWNDRKIAVLNAGVSADLGHNQRDPSCRWLGTTFILPTTSSKVAATGRARLAKKLVKWPVVPVSKVTKANHRQQTQARPAMLEYAHALQNKMDLTQLRNKDGLFVAPSEESFGLQHAHADWGQGSGFPAEILTSETEARPAGRLPAR